MPPAPTLSTSFLHINSTNSTQYNLEGTCENGLDVILTLGDLPPWTLSCNSGNWALADANVTALNNALEILLTVKQTDGTGK